MSDLTDCDCSCGHPLNLHKGGCVARKCQCVYYMTSETRTALWNLMGWGMENQPDDD